jgi:hypothetical protein
MASHILHTWSVDHLEDNAGSGSLLVLYNSEISILTLFVECYRSMHLSACRRCVVVTAMGDGLCLSIRVGNYLVRSYDEQQEVSSCSELELRNHLVFIWKYPWKYGTGSLDTTLLIAHK